jgi:hypothetical protein
MNRPEQDLQKAVAQYLDATLGPRVFWTAIPAGGGGGVRGAILKGMGYKAGTPDILIVHEGRAYWIEMKSPRGRVSDEQDLILTRLYDAGCPTGLCRSLEQVAELLGRWRIPTRGRIAA